MRAAFLDTCLELAADDERVWLVCGDLGYSVLEPFAAQFPGRFLNAGVAEQNMIGVAAGLAHSGMRVFVYSIVNFPVMRCLEQLRNDVCYHRLPVTVVAVGGGLVYGGHGYTHHAVEDLAVLRPLPYLNVVAPGDPVETRLATRAAYASAAPCYLRLGRGGEKPLHTSPPDYAFGRAMTLRPGDAATIISLGGTLDLAVEAADELLKEGVAVRVVSTGSLVPFDADVVRRAARETAGIVTVEEHGVGGLASAVAEVLAEAGAAVKFRPLRLRREPLTVAGSHAYLRAQHGLTTEAVIAAVRTLLPPPSPAGFAGGEGGQKGPP